MSPEDPSPTSAHPGLVLEFTRPVRHEEPQAENEVRGGVRCEGPQVHAEGRCRALLEEHTLGLRRLPAAGSRGPAAMKPQGGKAGEPETQRWACRDLGF